MDRKDLEGSRRVRFSKTDTNAIVFNRIRIRVKVIGTKLRICILLATRSSDDGNASPKFLGFYPCLGQSSIWHVSANNKSANTLIAVPNST